MDVTSTGKNQHERRVLFKTRLNIITARGSKGGQQRIHLHLAYKSGPKKSKATKSQAENESRKGTPEF